MASTLAEDLISVRSHKLPTLCELLEDIPKQITRDFLQRIYVTLLDCDPENIPQNEAAISSLLAKILEEKTSSMDRIFALIILAKLAPQNGLEEMLVSLPVEQLVTFLSVLLSQDKHCSHLQQIHRNLINSVKSKKMRTSSKILVHIYLTHLLEQAGNRLTSEDVRIVLDQLPEYLMDTSKSSGIKSSSSQSRFRKTDPPQPVSELDGVVSQDLFTVLSCAKFNSADQNLNVAVFSTLKPWLTQALRDQYLDPKLISAVKQYCLCIIDQSERNPLNPEDIDAQNSALTEAISLLDILCQMDSSQVPHLLPAVRRVLDMSFYKHAAITVSVMQFLLNHGSAVMYKLDDVNTVFFNEIVPSCFSNTLAAFEVITFIRKNLLRLCFSSSILEKYFPTLLKVFAWNATIFMDEFFDILPAFMSQGTSVEVFHSLVDLPCAVASLVVVWEGKAVDDTLIETISQPPYNSMMKFILRNTSGIGDTFEGVPKFHEAISCLANHPRVVQCSECVPELLRCYFEIFTQYADASLAVHLLPAILERLTLVYCVEGYVSKLQRVLAEMIPSFFKKFPDTIFHLTIELVSFLSNLSNCKASKEFFTNLVWAVGEFASPNETELSSPKAITQYYEGLECIFFEVSGAGATEEHEIRLLCVVITTLSKLAVRCQDLVPRVLLCLAKANQMLLSASKGETLTPSQEILFERVQELNAVLQMSNAASTILSPPKEEELKKCHDDVDQLPLILQLISETLGGDRG